MPEMFPSLSSVVTNVTVHLIRRFQSKSEHMPISWTGSSCNWACKASSAWSCLRISQVQVYLLKAEVANMKYCSRTCSRAMHTATSVAYHFALAASLTCNGSPGVIVCFLALQQYCYSAAPVTPCAGHQLGPVAKAGPGEGHRAWRKDRRFFLMCCCIILAMK